MRPRSLSSVDNVSSHHGGAQGRDFAGRELRSVADSEVAARLLPPVGGAPGCGRACPALGGLSCWRPVVGSCSSWRDCPAVRLPAVALGAGVPVGLSVGPGRSGIRSPSRGRPSSSSVWLRWVPSRWTNLQLEAGHSVPGPQSQRSASGPPGPGVRAVGQLEAGSLRLTGPLAGVPPAAASGSRPRGPGPGPVTVCASATSWETLVASG